MKQSLSLSMIKQLVPTELDSQELQTLYTDYARRHGIAARFFAEQVRHMAGPILQHSEDSGDVGTERPEDLIETSAIIGGFARLLAEKLLLLDGKDLTNGGEIAIHGERE